MLKHLKRTVLNVHRVIYIPLIFIALIALAFIFIIFIQTPPKSSANGCAPPYGIEESGDCIPFTNLNTPLKLAKGWSFKFTYAKNGNQINTNVINISISDPQGQSPNPAITFVNNGSSINAPWGTLNDYAPACGSASYSACNQEVQEYILSPLSQGELKDGAVYDDVYILGTLGSTPMALYGWGGSIQNAYSIPVSGGSSTVINPNTVEPWYNSKYQEETKTQAAKNLIFLSPQTIYDKQTGTYYTSDGDGQYANNGNLRVINDGDTIYWPSHNGSTTIDPTKKVNGRCQGGIDVETNTNNNYIDVFLIPAVPGSGGVCVFGTQNGGQTPLVVATYSPGTFYDSQDGSDAKVQGFVQDNNYKLDMSLSNTALEYAMFTWQDSTNITSVAALGDPTIATADNTLTRLTDPKKSADLQAAIASGFTQAKTGKNWEVFTTNNCLNGSASYPFILVNQDTSKSISINDVGTSTNAEAYFFYPNSNQTGISNGAHNGFPSGQVNCLFPDNYAPTDNPINSTQAGYSNGYGHTFIADVQKSVSTTAYTPPTSTTSYNTANEGLAICQETGGPLSWFTCAIIDGINTAESWIEGLVKDFLQTPPITLNGSSCQSGPGNQNYTNCIYNVWSQFRIYGNILLVVVLLVAVIAEAIGGGTFEAYTVRKILPRILLTAILINLSIYLMAGLLDITNAVGSGIFDLLSAPFKNTGTYHINITAGTGNLFGAAATLGLLGSGFALVFLHQVHGLGDALGFLMLFVGLPVILAVIGVVLTLFFRSAILVLLLMVSPVAFALYCLPNTEQYFRQWWKLLFRTLLVYPIVMIVFALCDLGSVIVSSFPYKGEQWLGELMAIVGVSAPLFLIPFAFKLSGGAIGSISEFISSNSHRLSEAIKGNVNDANSLRNRTKRRFGVKRSASGLTWGAIGTRINPRQIYSAQARETAQNRLKAHKQIGQEKLRRETEETANWRAIQGDSNIMKQLAWYRNKGEARAAANKELHDKLYGEDGKSGIYALRGTIPEADFNSRVAAAQREYTQTNAAIEAADIGSNGWNQAARRAAFMNPYQVKFEMPTGEEGWNKAVDIMDDLSGATMDPVTGHRISGGDELQFRSLMDEYQAVAKSGNVGRFDQAGNTDGSRVYNGNKAANNASPYERAMGSPLSEKGLSKYYEGVLDRLESGSLEETGRDADFYAEAKSRGVPVEDVAAEAIGKYYSETVAVSRSAKGGTGDAAIAARLSIGKKINNSSKIRDYVLRQRRPETAAMPPTDLADSLARTDMVAMKARAYETAEEAARRAAEGGGGGGGGATGGAPPGH